MKLMGFRFFWTAIIVLCFQLSISSQISPIPDGFLCGEIIFEEGFEGGAPAGWMDIAMEQAKTGGFNEGWIVDQDTTITPDTGPLSAQEGTFYAYCDGSGPIPRGAQAVMTSSLISLVGSNRPGLIFYLNMHGQAGSFLLNVMTNGGKDQVLSPVSADIPGGLHTDSEWEEIYIDLTPYEGMEIKLEFVTTKPLSPSNGDISVDNIRICNNSVVETIPTMSEWGIINLFLILMIFATVTLQQRDMELRIV